METRADADGNMVTVRQDVPLAYRFSAATILARQPRYLGFDQPPEPALPVPPAPEPEEQEPLEEHLERVLAEVIELAPENVKVIRRLLKP